MKLILPVIFCLLFRGTPYAQIKLPVYADSVFGTYYQQRLSHFETLPAERSDIIFLGNSITDGAEWNELFKDSHVKNRGISGDITAGVLHRLNQVISGKPSKVFLLIGINDLARNTVPDSALKNIFLAADYITQQSPSTQLYVQSVLPVTDVYRKFGEHTNKGAHIKWLNKQLQHDAGSHHYTFIDLYTSFSDTEGKLNADLTNDGVHLNGAGYLLWKHLVYPQVFDLQNRPSLIPLPQQLNWKNGYFDLYACKKIVARDTTLLAEAGKLQKQLQSEGLQVNIVHNINSADPFIELRLNRVIVPQLAEEAYHLEVNNQKVIISANTPHGIFNGIQTLQQLMRDNTMIDACEITDWPAFSWRGYMVDVGRNYQSADLLKQQVEIMGKYKLNIFHLHFTEDIAWRLENKLYPQLTAQENMLRNKGLYYTENEFKELINFCKERYITLVPEIDMPGHSGAFTRAMKTTMQTDSGLLIIKNILKEFFETYHLPYLHIGADEVKITNKNFLPQVIKYAESFDKKIIGWDPGGNFTSSTIRQLWMDDAGKLNANSIYKYIDSRHLYLNHMDPMEAVTTIFNRKILNAEKGDNLFLGGSICMWPDRAVAKETDILNMNPVYPSMLAFSERSWRGGGHNGWVANIGEPGSARAIEFSEFENRLLDQQQLNFRGLPFPYKKQSSVIWKLYGPYSNKGELSMAFEPEKLNFDESKFPAAIRAAGGTIVLRHWWYPLIKGVIEEPKENTTWYCVTHIWSDEDMIASYWIGFNNLSRSPATNSPPAKAWDNKQSQIWVNSNLITPPEWKRPGQPGNAEVPLVDEGYEYRTPTKISLHKGWNTVLIKAPVGSFKAANWQNPVKWMFTFVKAID
ncbi:MAG: family 20 glycosylhydrolase [Chitinophagaceae bacterium]